MSDKKKTPKKDKASTPLKAIEKLAQQVEALEMQLTEAQDQKIRALADLENVRRREAENKKQWSEMANAEFARKLIPAFLELQLGANHSSDEDIKKVVEKLFASAATQGLVAINPKPGDEVDPHQHEVLMAEPGESGKIVKVLEPGWQLGTTVIQPAKVSAGQDN